MVKQIKTMEQLRDSRLLFDKKVPAFGYLLILIITVFLAGAVVWSIKTPKIYMITAYGTVTSSDANYVMSSYTGEIGACNMQEGMLVEEGDILFTIKSTEYNLQQEQLEENRVVYEKKVEQYQRLVDSIKDDTNYFDASNSEDNLYYSTFEAYKSQIAQNQLNTDAYKVYGYTDEQIASELERNQGKIDELYYSALQSAESAIQEANTQIESINAQLLAINSGQAEYAVRATASGTLHLLEEYKEGMVVQATVSVATITPENARTIIEACVSTADMARMHEGDAVQIAVDGLSESVYGNITGTVVQIDSNLTVQESRDGSSSQVFRVKIVPDVTYLINRTGDKVDLANGMTAQARVQYDKVTYWNYMLEKLGLKAK